jgi:hypothetical protein
MAISSISFIENNGTPLVAMGCQFTSSLYYRLIDTVKVVVGCLAIGYYLFLSILRNKKKNYVRTLVVADALSLHMWLNQGQLPRSCFKTPSKAQLVRHSTLADCKPLQNAHILPCMLRFFIGLRLALEPNLRF